MFLVIAASIALTSCAGLQGALDKAKGGDTILLPAGACGAVALNDRQYDAPVTIRSADPKRRAVFTRLTLNNPRNLTLAGIEVTNADSNAAVMVRINNGSAVTFDDLYVHGVIDGNVAKDASGVSAFNVDGLTVSNSRFVEINAGIKAEQSRGVTIRGNDIGFIGSDAIEIPGSNGVTIAWNMLHDFRTNPGVHPDGVQCWTTRQVSGCKNVRIFRNEIIGSPGHEPQGIFFGDEDRVGGYENIEITGNRFVCTMWHAINIYSGPKNVTIRFNEVVAGPNYTPWIRVDAPSVLEGNVAPGYFIGGSVKASVVPAGNYVP
ncbi:hypothetical protein ABIC65_001112 [Sphingomonas trueperi]|uniref:right-handed parallel beta-helix repeat-containing protein n=1 Tax=Sphingomonas trueperi TaxID=53317 RepID=UPI0033960730